MYEQSVFIHRSRRRFMTAAAVSCAMLMGLAGLSSTSDRQAQFSQSDLTVAPISSLSHATASPQPGEPVATKPVEAPRMDLSGEQPPHGDLTGWNQVFVDDFNTDVARGQFPGTAYGNTWDVYPDGTKDTAGQNEGGIGRYYPSRVVSVSDGILNKYLHTSNGVANVAALLPKAAIGQQYGRYSVRFRADPVPGYKMAWLLWPTSERWPDDGEVDFPEGNLTETMYGASIYSKPWTGQHESDKFESNATFDEWHTATTEWLPGKVSFYLDGKLLGTSTHLTPDTPMKWVLQTETCIGSCQPGPQASGNVQIDWVAVWKMA